MRRLAWALFAEGRSDHDFLQPLLRRLLEWACRDATSLVEIAPDPLELHGPAGSAARRRLDRICLAAKDSASAFHLLFIHADGDSDWQEALAKRVEPARQELRRGDRRLGVVAVIPVRETEAWVLADQEALRRCLGVPSRAKAPDPPGLSDVERLTDPKKALRELHFAAVGDRSQRKYPISTYLRRLGEEVSLASLRRLASFQRLQAELSAWLCAQTYLP
ncbi:MAG: DUF4276 family protein [Fimbriimonadaceae bacterium]|nr:DUF4276 family protein [Fimbriimonadaceae bacterium]